MKNLQSEFRGNGNSTSKAAGRSVRSTQANPRAELDYCKVWLDDSELELPLML
jgi:hypothetical protein